MPRRINVLCDRALLAAGQAKQPRVDGKLVDRVAREVFGRPQRPGGTAVAATATASLDAAEDTAVPVAAPRRVWVMAGLALVVGLLLSPWLHSWLAGPAPARFAAPAGVVEAPASGAVNPPVNTPSAAVAGLWQVAQAPRSVPTQRRPLAWTPQDDLLVGLQLTDRSTHVDAEGSDGSLLGWVACRQGPPRRANVRTLRDLAVVWAADLARGGAYMPAYCPGGEVLQSLVAQECAALIE